MLLIGFRDTYPIIFYRNNAVSIIDLRIKFYKSVFAGVFNGI